MIQIPYNKPSLVGNENEYINDSVRRGHISGDGYYTKKIHEFIEQKFGTKKALMTTSCSSALDMAALLLDLKDEDEVILPSYTFVSTANSIVTKGAKPVFADIELDTLNIDPDDIMRKITKKTKAIFPVHYAGVACKMDKIMQIAEDHNLMVVEDAAQGVNAKFQKKFLGTIGDIGCYSFHETKNYSCGEGGAILINRDDPKLMERAEIIREKGTNRNKFFRGEVDKYTWVDIGSSYLPSDLLAAYLFAQFEKLDFISEQRKKIYDYYYVLLKPLEERCYLRLPIIPEDCLSNYHIFYLLLNSETERNQLMNHLKQNGVLAIFHYIPLHLSPMGERFGYRMGDLPQTESLSSRLLRLPMYVELKEQEQDYIVKLVFKAFNRD